MNTSPRRRKIGKDERRAVYEKCNRHCAYCGKQMAISEMQVDHLIPMQFHEAYLKRGIDIDSMQNYMPACRSCNHYKDTMTLEKFRAAIEKMPAVLMRDSVTYRNAVRFGLVKPDLHPIKFYFEQLEEKHAAPDPV